MEKILGADKEIVAWYFSFLSFTAPVSGVIVGGIVTQYLGGYNSKRGQEI